MLKKLLSIATAVMLAGSFLLPLQAAATFTTVTQNPETTQKTWVDGYNPELSAVLTNKDYDPKVKTTDKAMYLIYMQRDGMKQTFKCDVYSKAGKKQKSYDLSPLIKKYNISETKQIDVTDGKIAFVSGNAKIYLTDFKMKTVTLLAELTTGTAVGKPNGFHEIALTDDSVGFWATGNASNKKIGDTTYASLDNYYGIVNIKTKTLEYHAKSDVCSVRAFSNRMIWGNIPAIDYKGDKIVPKTEEIVTYEDGTFKKFQTKTNYGRLYENGFGANEGFRAVVDNDGKVLTFLEDYDKNMNLFGVTFHVYENGVCVKEFSKTFAPEGKGDAVDTVCGFAAKDGKILVNYSAGGSFKSLMVEY